MTALLDQPALLGTASQWSSALRAASAVHRGQVEAAEQAGHYVVSLGEDRNRIRAGQITVRVATETLGQPSKAEGAS